MAAVKHFFQYLVGLSLLLVFSCFVMGACSLSSEKNKESNQKIKEESAKIAEKNYIADERTMDIIISKLKQENPPPEKAIEILDNFIPQVHTSEAAWALISLKIRYMGLIEE